MTCLCSKSRFRWLRKFARCLHSRRLLRRPLRSCPKPRQTPANHRRRITAFAYTPDAARLFCPSQFQNQALRPRTRRHLAARRRRQQPPPLEARSSLAAISPSATSEILSASPPTAESSSPSFSTTTVVDEAGKTEDSFQTLLLDDSGKEIHIAKGDSVIPDAADRSSSRQRQRFKLLSEAVKTADALLPESHAPQHRAFKSPQQDRTFRDVRPSSRSVFRHRRGTGPRMTGPSASSESSCSPRRHRARHARQLRRRAQRLPHGKKVAYFIDKEFWRFAISLRPISRSPSRRPRRFPLVTR